MVLQQSDRGHCNHHIMIIRDTLLFPKDLFAPSAFWQVLWLLAPSHTSNYLASIAQTIDQVRLTNAWPHPTSPLFPFFLLLIYFTVLPLTSPVFVTGGFYFRKSSLIVSVPQQKGWAYNLLIAFKSILKLRDKGVCRVGIFSIKSHITFYLYLPLKYQIANQSK